MTSLLQGTFLVSFRNYCFAETRNSRDEQYAEGASTDVHGSYFRLPLRASCLAVDDCPETKSDYARIR